MTAGKRVRTSDTVTTVRHCQ